MNKALPLRSPTLFQRVRGCFLLVSLFSLLASCGLPQLSGPFLPLPSPTPAPVITPTPISLALPFQQVRIFREVVWLSKDELFVTGDEGLIRLPTVAGQFRPQSAAQIVARHPTLFAVASAARTLAWVEQTNALYLFEPTATSVPRLLVKNPTPLTGVALSTDGQLLAYAAHDGALHVVHPQAPSSRLQMQSLKHWQLPFWASHLALSPQGQRIAFASLADFKVVIRDLQSGTDVGEQTWPDPPLAALYGVFLSPDWRYIAWVSQNLVRVSAVDSGQFIGLLAHEESVMALAWSPQGDILATASAATIQDTLTPAVLLWEARSADLIATFAQEAPIVSLSFSPTGDQLALLDSAGYLRVIPITIK